jgi:spermidine synthase
MFSVGKILGGEKVSINDALEILRHLAKLDSAITKGTEVEIDGEVVEVDKDYCFNAALITEDSKENEKVSINDALEIRRYLAKLDGILKDFYA